MRAGEDELSLRDLIAQLIESGKAYARAEVAYYKALVASYAVGAALGIGLLVAALLLVQAGLTVLFAAIGVAISQWAGIAGGLALAALLALMIAGMLAWIGVRRLGGGVGK